MQQKILSFIFLVTAIVFLMACTDPNTAVQSTATPIATAEQTAVLNASEECPQPDKGVDFAPQFFGPGLGQSPVWVVFPSTRQITFSEFPQQARTEHGVQVKMLWVVERAFSEVVTVEGNNMQTGEPVWFMLAGESAVTTLRLDPQHPTIPFQRQGYAEFPGSVLLSKPGCYTLRVVTPTKETSWQRNFTVIDPSQS